jgi:hypothetical protein
LTTEDVVFRGVRATWLQEVFGRTGVKKKQSTREYRTAVERKFVRILEMTVEVV